MMISFAMHDEKIIIIGGTGGMGLSAARAFIRNGAKVTVVGKEPAHAETAQNLIGSAGIALIGDASDEETAVMAIESSVKHFGGFTGLYHVAGCSGRKFGDGPLHELSLEGWEKTIALNLTSMMLSNRAAIKYFLATGNGGSILNMGSVLGFSPSPGFFTTHAYAAAKSAIIGFSKSIASCYAKDNIRVNVIAPAVIDTPMTERAMNNPDILQFVQTKQPLDGGRAGIPEDVDGAAVFLLSKAAKFITGQVLAVDGGWTVTEGQYQSISK
ncbi:MAG: SDR family NAD(P)-dependent oxidoreductase [Chitinophagaceae bacterium]